MAAYKRKIIAFLVVTVLGGGTLTLCAAQATETEPAKPPSDNSSGGRSSLFANDPNFLVGSANRLNTRELFFKMMLSILLVVVLGAAAVYVLKKFGARITNLPGKRIRIIETAHLGPRKTVHLLKVGNQHFLVGSTSESITKLAEITDEQMPDSV